MRRFHKEVEARRFLQKVSFFYSWLIYRILTDYFEFLCAMEIVLETTSKSIGDYWNGQQIELTLSECDQEKCLAGITR